MSTTDNQEMLVAGNCHIMFISHPLQGHLTPMIQFSKRLASRGIKVTIVTTTSLKITSNAQTTSINIEHISIDEPSSQGDTPDSIDESVALFKAGVTRGLPEVIEKYKTTECPVRVLVYDLLMPWALDISHKLGIAGAAFCTHSSAVFAIYYNVYSGTLETESVGELSSVKLPSLPVLGIKDLPSFVYDTGAYRGLTNLFESQFVQMDKASCLIFNTFDELEREVSNFLVLLIST